MILEIFTKFNDLVILALFLFSVAAVGLCLHNLSEVWRQANHEGCLGRQSRAATSAMTPPSTLVLAGEIL